MNAFQHQTVLRDTVIEALALRQVGLYVDATLGGGGHTEAILAATGSDVHVVGIDRDPEALAASRARLERFEGRFTLLHGSFGQTAELLQAAGISGCVAGLVADLGVSSPQLDRAERGFSFARPGPLDMRMDTTAGEPLSELIARLSAEELADVLYQYGDERRSRPIARSIKAASDRGELSSTEDLRRAIVRVTGPRRGGVDPATRSFQALRIAVNDELGELESLLAALASLLCEGGRAALISFHSGEDRMIKHTFRQHPSLDVLTKRPVVPSPEEQAQNPRSRSAKLRVAQRASQGDEP